MPANTPNRPDTPNTSDKSRGTLRSPADGMPGSAAPRRPMATTSFSGGNSASPLSDAARDELRRLIAEELRAVLKER